jgi:hypothetical protein
LSFPNLFEVVIAKKSKGKSLDSTATLGSPSSAHDFFLNSKNISSDNDQPVILDAENITNQNKQNKFNDQERNKHSPHSMNRMFPKHGAYNPIEIDDVREERKLTTIGIRQVTVGADHGRSECKLLLSNDYAKIFYTLINTSSIKNQRCHKINVEDIQLFQFHESADNDLFFVILRVKPTESNGLKYVTNYIKSIEHNWDKTLLSTDGYIVLDVASGQDLQQILDWFCDVGIRRSLSIELTSLTFDECKKYAETMLNTAYVRDRLQNKKQLKSSNFDFIHSKYEGKNEETQNSLWIHANSDIASTSSPSWKMNDSQKSKL